MTTSIRHLGMVTYWTSISAQYQSVRSFHGHDQVTILSFNQLLFRRHHTRFTRSSTKIKLIKNPISNRRRTNICYTQTAINQPKKLLLKRWLSPTKMQSQFTTSNQLSHHKTMFLPTASETKTPKRWKESDQKFTESGRSSSLARSPGPGRGELEHGRIQPRVGPHCRRENPNARTPPPPPPLCCCPLLLYPRSCTQIYHEKKASRAKNPALCLGQMLPSHHCHLRSWEGKGEAAAATAERGE